MACAFPGIIGVSPLRGSDGELRFDDATLAHEFGHTCSGVLIQLAAGRRGEKRDSPEARDAQAYMGQFLEAASSGNPSGPFCAVTPEVRRTFQRVFTQLGASEATFSCLSALASQAVSPRFQAGQCKDACPMSYLEESLADWVAMFAMPESAMPAFLTGLCQGVRDDIHPMAADMLRCFAKSKKVLERMIAHTGCS